MRVICLASALDSEFDLDQGCPHTSRSLGIATACAWNNSSIVRTLDALADGLASLSLRAISSPTTFGSRYQLERYERVLNAGIDMFSHPQ